MIESLDTIVRLISVGACLMLLLVLILGPVRAPLKLALGGLLVSTIAYLFNSSTVIFPAKEIRPYIDLASVFTPFWTWLFGRRLFEDEPPVHLVWLSAVALIVSWFLAHFGIPRSSIGFYAIHVISLGLVIDLLRIAIGDRADDLVEKRRIIRVWLPLLVALQTGGVLVFETVVGEAIPFPPVQLINASLIFALILFAGVALLRTDEELLIEPSPASPEVRSHAELSASENVLRENLDVAMA